jgi:penicillin-binding protein 2
MPILRTILTTTTLGLLLSACSAVEQFGAQQPGSSAVSLGNAPRAAVERFLTAWDTQNLDAMYSSVSARSQQLYTPEAFARYYQAVNENIGLEGVGFTVHDIHEQGTSAMVKYDVTLTTSLFGEITDTNRTMRLVQDSGQWRVAWSTMDIFDGYTADAAVRVDTELTARANIYDRSGQPLVEEGGTVSAIWVRKETMNGVADCQRLLADLLYTRTTNLDSLFQSYLADANFYVGEIDEEVEIEYQQQLAEVCGTTRDAGTILPRQTRKYYGQGAAVHLTGYIGPVPEESRAQWINRGYSENDLVGLAGIEFAYQSALAGRPPRVLRVVEPGGIVLAELGRTEGTPPQSVYTTVDRDLQIESARAVAWAYNYAINNWGRPDISPGAGAVAIDVNTGAILSMVSYPTFQPGLFNPDSFAPDRGPRLAEITGSITNRVTQQRYSPGSVYKIVTTAAVINEGLMDPNDGTFFCGLTWDGRVEFGDASSPRLDWRFTDGLDATGYVDPSEALTSSCDPFYYEFGARLYLERSPAIVVEYSEMMGLGAPTGIGVYQEAQSALPVPQSVDEAINNAIGQGNTQVTILQVAQMVAAVANGGTLYQPYVVDRVGGQTVGEPTVVGTLDLSPEALAAVQRGMCDVTSNPDKGTAFSVFDGNGVYPPYRACGKTGTSQTTTYPQAWFVAYAPADDPQIAVVAMGERSREGSEVAAPMVRRILDHYFNAPEIAPFPEWWEGEYVPLAVPDNGVAGG